MQHRWGSTDAATGPAHFLFPAEPAPEPLGHASDHPPPPRLSSRPPAVTARRATEVGRGAAQGAAVEKVGDWFVYDDGRYTTLQAAAYNDTEFNPFPRQKEVSPCNKMPVRSRLLTGAPPAPYWSPPLRRPRATADSPTLSLADSASWVKGHEYTVIRAPLNGARAKSIRRQSGRVEPGSSALPPVSANLIAELSDAAVPTTGPGDAQLEDHSMRNGTSPKTRSVYRRNGAFVQEASAVELRRGEAGRTSWLPMICDESRAPARETSTLKTEDAVRQYLVSLKCSATQDSSCGLKDSVGQRARRKRVGEGGAAARYLEIVHADPEDFLSTERRSGGLANKKRGANSRQHQPQHRTAPRQIVYAVPNQY
jgi:hypothetical protein